MIPIQASAGARWDHRAGPGAYRAAFVDPNGGRTLEYHHDSPDYAGATPFNRRFAYERGVGVPNA